MEKLAQIERLIWVTLFDVKIRHSVPCKVCYISRDDQDFKAICRKIDFQNMSIDFKLKDWVIAISLNLHSSSYLFT